MKTTLIVITVLIIAACSSTKKSPAPTPSQSPELAPSPQASNGIYAPGNEELNAIQVRYKDVTLDKLTFGHAIYTKGACINCHRAKNIYKLDEVKWKIVLDEMAILANISDEQKDAVYKYVLAIKATQPK